MYHILFNPLSNGGNGPKKLNKLTSYLTKQQSNYTLKNILQINDIKAFIINLAHNDIIILVGGDGTLNQVANHLVGHQINNKIFLYRAGTGNDFYRNFKETSKHGLIDITDKLSNLPTISFNNQEHLFLNGSGLGVDGLICEYVNSSTKKKSALNYYRNCFKALWHYKPKNVKVNIDGTIHPYKKVWLATVMHGKFLGGGMKIAPKRNRQDATLQVIVVNRVNLFLLFLILPTIYLGWHRFFTSFVHFHEGREINIQIDEPVFLQVDGDVYKNVEGISARR